MTCPTIDAIVQNLKRSTIFRDVEANALRALAREGDTRRVRDGAALWEWGELGHHLHLILEGTVECSRPLQNGGRALLWTLGRGDLDDFCAVAGEAHSSDAWARGTVRVARLPVRAVRKVLKLEDELPRGAMAEVLSRYADLMDQLLQPHDRCVYPRLLRALPPLADEEGVVRRTHAELACHIGAERANVSRALKRMQREGLVLLGRKKITLLGRLRGETRGASDAPWIVSREVVPMPFDDARCHAATIAHAGDGLALAFFGGERPETQDLWVMRQDQGRWTQPKRVATAGKPGSSCWNPVLHQVQGGPLQLFYHLGPGPSSWRGFMKTSWTGGRTWESTTCFPDGMCGPTRNKPISLHDGSELFPSSREGGPWQVHFERRTSDGLTWTSSEPLPDPEGFGAIQPALIPWAADRIQALCRSQVGGIVQSWSSDGGVTWTKLERTGLPNPNSAIDVTRLPDGRALLIYNPTGQGRTEFHAERSPLSLAVSEDGCEWKDVGSIESGDGEFSYPATSIDSNGLLHVTYTARPAWREIRHVVIDPSLV